MCLYILLAFCTLFSILGGRKLQISPRLLGSIMVFLKLKLGKAPEPESVRDWNQFPVSFESFFHLVMRGCKTRGSKNDTKQNCEFKI